MDNSNEKSTTTERLAADATKPRRVIEVIGVSDEDGSEEVIATIDLEPAMTAEHDGGGDGKG